MNNCKCNESVCYDAGTREASRGASRETGEGGCNGVALLLTDSQRVLRGVKRLGNCALSPLRLPGLGTSPCPLGLKGPKVVMLRYSYPLHRKRKSQLEGSEAKETVFP